MIPVILTTNAVDTVRQGVASACFARWLEIVEAGALHVIDAGSSMKFDTEFAVSIYWPGGEKSWRDIPPEGSLRHRHAVARDILDASDSEWAIFTDDDILVDPDPAWINAALQILRIFDKPDHPWGLVTVALESGKTGAAADGPIREVANCGGLRFVRRGALPAELPPFDDHPGYDHILTQAVRDNGFRVGSIFHPAVQVRHLGEGLSTIWDDGLKGQPEQQR